MSNKSDRKVFHVKQQKQQKQQSDKRRSRRYYECWSDMYTVSCALYAMARRKLDRCEMAALIAEIMMLSSWAYIADAIRRRLVAAGVHPDEIARIYRRYM